MSGSTLVLRLYVAGATPHSLMAVKNITRICEQYYPGSYDLKVIDIYQQPELANNEQIIAAPTLIRDSPSPERRLIGDLSAAHKVMALLDIGGSSGE